jgi:HEAT repeat protein
MEKDGQAAAATSRAPGPAILTALEDLLMTLRKSSKDLAFYPLGHPRLTRSLERATEQLHAVVATRALLSLAVSRTGFTCEGQSVGKENQQLAIIAGDLFVRRIQRITFAQEVRAEELTAFLRVITSDPKQLVQQGGPAKVLTAHGVGRIQVTEFDFRRVGPGLPEKKEVLSPEESIGDDSPASLKRVGEVAPQKSATPESVLAAFDPREEPTVEALIQRLVQEAASGGIAGYEWTTSRLEVDALQAVQDDRLKDVLAILQVFLAHRRAERLKGELRERAARAVETIGGDKTETYLIDHLRTEEGGLARDASAILASLGPRGIPRVLRLLVAEDLAEVQERLAATLVRFHESAESEVAQALQALDRDQARHLAPILGDVGGAAGVALLASLFRHRDARVREQALRAAGRIDEPGAQRLLIQAIRDPSLAVLEVAVGLAGATKLKLATPTLLRLAGQRVLRGKPFAVRKAAIAALGTIGDPGTIPLLRRLLYTRTWFQRQAGHEIRQAAAMALLAMDCVDAREVVEAGARSRRRAVRRACTEALQAGATGQ